MHVSLWNLRLPKLKVFCLKHLFDLCVVAPNFKTVKSERSDFTQVLPEFRVPKNAFHVLPQALKSYIESLEIAFYCRMSFTV